MWDVKQQEGGVKERQGSEGINNNKQCVIGVKLLLLWAHPRGQWEMEAVKAHTSNFFFGTKEHTTTSNRQQKHQKHTKLKTSICKINQNKQSYCLNHKKLTTRDWRGFSGYEFSNWREFFSLNILEVGFRSSCDMQYFSTWVISEFASYFSILRLGFIWKLDWYISQLRWWYHLLGIQGALSQVIATMIWNIGLVWFWTVSN